MDLKNIMMINISDTGVSLTFNGGMASYDKNGHLEGSIGERSVIPTHVSFVDSRSNPQNSNQSTKSTNKI
ncbi:hypothetical protein QDQ39_01580 [Providencia rettgeri]|uniref:hypothetical protein n=1 Tax=Providencia TaxID=586 RepID=UPI000D702A9A|nr:MULTISPECIES: hypothetical protein [Providencia]ELR5294903.1 hypothetical protein [Providencia rettgeri]MCG5292311.1 hypothetical protein [Providencia rettgeri]MCL0014599.1 hypothetical protein [Providencia rettgeri]MDH2394495.1 hypothetical protein [Providencia rettgeri]MDM9282476.1 hypothetical protein [Providencia rettgeri]